MRGRASSYAASDLVVAAHRAVGLGHAGEDGGFLEGVLGAAGEAQATVVHLHRLVELADLVVHHAGVVEGEAEVEGVARALERRLRPLQ